MRVGRRGEGRGEESLRGGAVRERRVQLIA